MDRGLAVTRYVALLGSINVGGNRLKMGELKAALEAEGFENVATVVASGNVLFDHAKAGDARLEDHIAVIVKERFGIDTFAAVRSRDELKASIDDNPFAGQNEDKFVHTIFLQEPLDRGSFEEFEQAYEGPERLAAGTREFFVDFREGVADSRLGQAMRKLKLRSTARNVRSLHRMLDKMDS
jgi:uncharacterized protein (DUF1697 family)